MVYEAGHTTVHASNFLYFRMAAGGPILFTRDCFEYSEEDDLLGSGSFGSVYRCRLTKSEEESPELSKAASRPVFTLVPCVWYYRLTGGVGYSLSIHTLFLASKHARHIHSYLN